MTRLTWRLFTPPVCWVAGRGTTPDSVAAVAVTIDELLIADRPRAWTSAGFSLDPGGVCRVGDVRLRLLGEDAGSGLTGWTLRDLPAGLSDIDGVPTARSDAPPADPMQHANGVKSIDHVVLLSPDVDRTVAALAALDLHPRRERADKLGGLPVRQVFYRLGSVVLEVVGPRRTTKPGPSSLWGITFTVADIDATAERLGERATPVKDAVQPGRRITTVRHRDFGMSVRVAMISPP